MFTYAICDNIVSSEPIAMPRWDGPVHFRMKDSIPSVLFWSNK